MFPPTVFIMPPGKAALVPYVLVPICWFESSWWLWSQKGGGRGSSPMERVILGTEIRVRNQTVKTLMSSWLGDWSFRFVPTSVTLCCYFMGMIEKRVRSHPLSPWNVPFSSIEAEPEQENRLSLFSGDGGSWYQVTLSYKVITGLFNSYFRPVCFKSGICI